MSGAMAEAKARRKERAAWSRVAAVLAQPSDAEIWADDAFWGGRFLSIVDAAAEATERAARFVQS